MAAQALLESLRELQVRTCTAAQTGAPGPRQPSAPAAIAKESTRYQLESIKYELDFGMKVGGSNITVSCSMKRGCWALISCCYFEAKELRVLQVILL